MPPRDPYTRVRSFCHDQADLVEHDPKRFFVPPYVGPQGWVGARLDLTPQWKMIESVLLDAYRLQAPKTLLAKLLSR